MKNIVICCDGTNAQYGPELQSSNILRLYERLGPDGDHQISYYDPGVGTTAFPRPLPSAPGIA